MIKIKLTAAQRQQLKPFFDAVEDASAAGKYGAIGAQVWPDGMCVMFFDEKKGRALSKALGGNYRNTSSTASAFMAAVPSNYCSAAKNDIATSPNPAPKPHHNAE